MEAYFDNGATTRVFPQVKDIVIEAMEEEYGNPSSMHMKGVKAEQYVKDAREIIAKSLKVDPKEIVFTSGGTESNNMALIGTAMANARKGKHIISTRIEHASVYNPLFFLEENGYEITYLPVDEHGVVDLEALEKAIRPDTILVSVMYVNNEIGAVQPVEEIGKIVKKKNPDTLFHVDAIQAYGKYHIYPRRLKIDLLSVSGHKIHGPKGIGFLYIKDKTKVHPLILGGGQQKGMRSGTENVPGIAGLGKAVQLIYQDHEEKMKKIQAIKDDFIAQVMELSDVRNNSGEAPHIASISFQGVRSEVLLHALEEKGIYVSSGSACSSNKPAISGTLKAIGLTKEYYDSTLRFSFCIFNTKEEVDYTVNCLRELLPILRRFTRK
ncbi:MAG: cysteine desulfurase family protein [Candidatus Fimousia sp.]|uniref:cysteine desulfurase family protein n=1 Tax=Anaerostipes sp. 992a TaxID=1261637 RepID=UPI00095329B1|nr:cysteine desulfurase family protein [Anaerostipes sp. 992a]MDD5968873.1 cysteine desulfurase family protein [Anaerostipes sp.]OLR63877.1 cysteine desulfurase NifS [Anaerostipes sp. 992a]